MVQASDWWCKRVVSPMVRCAADRRLSDADRQRRRASSPNPLDRWFTLRWHPELRWRPVMVYAEYLRLRGPLEAHWRPIGHCGTGIGQIGHWRNAAPRHMQAVMERALCGAHSTGLPVNMGWKALKDWARDDERGLKVTYVGNWDDGDMGMGVCDFETEAMMHDAIRLLHGVEVDGRAVSVCRVRHALTRVNAV
jgi:hypothetical protein